MMTIGMYPSTSMPSFSLTLFTAVVLCVQTINAQWRSDCGIKFPKRVYAPEGEVTESNLSFGAHLGHKWIFDRLPNDDTMLLINITHSEYAEDSIELFDEKFVHDSIYCYVLKYSSPSEFNRTETEILQKKYPLCKIRQAKRSNATITFCKRNLYLPDPVFTIRYKAVTLHSEAVTTSPVPTTGSDSAEKQDRERAKSLTIIIAVLGSLLVLLILLMAVMLFVRQRRLKLQVTTNDDNRPQNDIYFTIQDNDSRTLTNEIGNFSEIQNGGHGTIPPSRGQNERVSVKNVVNPLYESKVTNHAYEYIDVKRFPIYPERNNNPTYESV